MSMRKPIGIGLLVVAFLTSGPLRLASGSLVQSANVAMELPQADLACKIKVETITESETGSPSGTKCDATCQAISWLKGDAGSVVKITFRRNGNGPFMPGRDAVKAGGVYIVMLRGKSPPYQVLNAMRAAEAVADMKFGTRPGDRLLDELVATWKSNEDASVRLAAIEQIGLIKDTRGVEAANEAAKSQAAETSRAGVIAQYRMKIAPDAKRVMELFNEQMMDVWYQESGIPQKDSKGESIWRREEGHPFLERGLPDFDHATYVREGIKKDWVRKDDHALYLFFGVPWKVQRKSCVPELVKLLDDPDKKVRWYAVLSLAHTVEDEDRPQWEQYEKREEEELAKWRTWWKAKGTAFMAEPVAK